MTEAATACGGAYDLIVIGSGPAGQKAAVQAATAGCRVALLERDRRVGGACVHSGTIPSKALREQALRRLAAERYAGRTAEQDPLPDAAAGGGGADEHRGAEPARRLCNAPLAALLADVAQIVSEHDQYMTAQLQRNGIDCLHGRARFVAPTVLELCDVRGARRNLTAPRIVIATGSRPRAPREITVDHERVLDSDSILSLSGLPRTLLVIGGGVIASEYASVFAALGCRITQVDRAERPLAFMDAELVARYLAQLRSRGGEFRPGRRAIGSEWHEGRQQTLVRFDDGSEAAADKVLVALGRVANVEDLGLAAAGLALSESGHLAVDDELQTAVRGIYAAGDVIGPPALASAAMEQGRRAACGALGLSLELQSGASVPLPSGVYTVPEMATVGLDAAEAARRGLAVRIGRSSFAEIARGRIAGCTDGLMKLVADDSGQRLLGVQVVGDGATELVHLGQLAIAARMPVEALVETVFNFPTFAEAYRVAALDILRQARMPTERPALAAISKPG